MMTCCLSIVILSLFKYNAVMGVTRENENNLRKKKHLYNVMFLRFIDFFFRRAKKYELLLQYTRALVIFFNGIIIVVIVIIFFFFKYANKLKRFITSI